jgi:hypothetical protein
MSAFIEHLTSLIRVGGADAKHGDAYRAAVTVRWQSPTHVEMVGLVADRFTPADFKAIEQLLATVGVRIVTWIRLKNGKSRLVTWNIRQCKTNSVPSPNSGPTTIPAAHPG